MDTVSIIIYSLKGIGIDLEDEMGADIDLRYYITDSVLFISFVIELESNLGIELPYEMLLYEKLASLEGFCGMIDNLRHEITVLENNDS